MVSFSVNWRRYQSCGTESGSWQSRNSWPRQNWQKADRNGKWLVSHWRKSCALCSVSDSHWRKTFRRLDSLHFLGGSEITCYHEACVCVCVCVVCVTVWMDVWVCVHAFACEEVNVSVQVSVCNHIIGGCVWNALVLMYVFTVLFCAFLIVTTVLVLFWLSCWY